MEQSIKRFFGQSEKTKNMCVMKMQRLLTWRKNTSGAVALEFALVSIPFFLVVIGIIELAMMFSAASVLEGGTHAAARVVRTGQVQGAADPLATFQAGLCNNVGGLIDCDRITHEVMMVADGNFAGAGAPQYDTDGNMVSRGFDPGGVSDVVVVRTAYVYTFATPLIGLLVSSRDDNAILLMSTVTIRNEPYEF